MEIRDEKSIQQTYDVWTVPNMSIDRVVGIMSSRTAMVVVDKGKGGQDTREERENTKG